MDLEALFNISYGVYIVTSKDGQLKAGCVVNSVMQVTSDEPTLLLSINKKNTTTGVILKSHQFGVSVLSRNVDLKDIGTFGYHSSKEVDKFKDIDYFESYQVPVVRSGVNAYMVVKVKETFDAGTHLLFFGQIIEAKKLNQDISLTYENYHQMKKGKNTSIETWICDVCGYEYHGNLTKLDEYTCPICGVDKTYFQKK